MSHIVTALSQIVAAQPDAIALRDKQGQVSWSEMLDRVTYLAAALKHYQGKVIALTAENQTSWVLMDLACLQAGVILLPLPAFFTESQQQHAIEQSGAVAIVLPKALALESDAPLTNSLFLREVIAPRKSAIPDGTVKITFTSGSTGQPKGVCLSESNQLNVARSLLSCTAIRAARHLCILPLPTLLENIAGVYTPLLSGGEVILLTPDELGFNGSSGLNIAVFADALERVKPDSIILLPALLSALIAYIKQGWKAPESLKFVAVGGSRVGSGLLKAASDVGLPVYEGYGLSECSSVVSLNTGAMNQVGTAGKVLSHLNVVFEDGEVVVKGNSFLGYVNEPDSWYRDRVYTGDLGFIDYEGYLHIMGRRKNLLISSFGRNINPEWIESELAANPAIALCVVLGDARPYCVALLYMRSSSISDQEIDAWITQVNSTLPDYARVRHWLRLPAPLSLMTGTLTANGKPVREAITRLYQTDIEHLYKEQA